jgi:hypothetical protein
MGRFQFWRSWLVVAAGAMAVFGMAMTLLSASDGFAVFNARIDPIFWNGAQPPASAIAFRTWAYAVWGATVTALGLLVALVARSAFNPKSAWVRDSLALCLIVWYALDTGASLAWGVTFNAAFNTVVLLALAAPLAFTWTAFETSPGASSP